jgi:heme/copper-type cytochrome/quinol oxidase subunit 3
MTGKEQARLLGLLFWLLTGFQILLVGVIAIFYIFFFGFIFASVPQGKDAPPPEFVIGIVVFVVALIFIMTLLFAVPKVVAGYGLRKEKSWAKIWAIIASVMAVMNFPFGTAVGIYGLIFILGDAGKAYFDSPNYGRLSTGFESGIPFDAQAGMHTPDPSGWRQ